MFLVSVLEAVTVESCLQPRCRIDEKERIIDEMFLAKFGEKHLDNRLISRRRELNVQQAVRVGIDSCVQPEPFVVELDHGLVNRDVIRVRTVEGL
ncbi:hypothetical protein GCM10009000_034950 [Halobacterium noricense]